MPRAFLVRNRRTPPPSSSPTPAPPPPPTTTTTRPPSQPSTTPSTASPLPPHKPWAEEDKTDEHTKEKRTKKRNMEEDEEDDEEFPLTTETAKRMKPSRTKEDENDDVEESSSMETEERKERRRRRRRRRRKENKDEEEDKYESRRKETEDHHDMESSSTDDDADADALSPCTFPRFRGLCANKTATLTSAADDKNRKNPVNEHRTDRDETTRFPSSLNTTSKAAPTSTEPRRYLLCPSPALSSQYIQPPKSDIIRSPSDNRIKRTSDIIQVSSVAPLSPTSPFFQFKTMPAPAPHLRRPTGFFPAAKSLRLDPLSGSPGLLRNDSCEGAKCSGTEIQCCGEDAVNSGKDVHSSGKMIKHSGGEVQTSGRQDQYSGREDQYSGREDQYSGREDQHSGREDQHSGRGDQHSGRQDQHSVREDQNSGRQAQHSGRQAQHSGREVQYSGGEVQRGGPTTVRVPNIYPSAFQGPAVFIDGSSPSPLPSIKHPFPIPPSSLPLSPRERFYASPPHVFSFPPAIVRPIPTSGLSWPIQPVPLRVPLGLRPNFGLCGVTSPEEVPSPPGSSVADMPTSPHMGLKSPPGLCPLRGRGFIRDVGGLGGCGGGGGGVGGGGMADLNNNNCGGGVGGGGGGGCVAGGAGVVVGVGVGGGGVGGGLGCSDEDLLAACPRKQNFKDFLETAKVRVETINDGNGLKNPLLSAEKSRLSLDPGPLSFMTLDAFPSCPVCGMKCDTPRLLQRHVRGHKEIKRYLCAWCGKGFNDTFDLKRHTRTHTGVRPYKCESCGKAFTQRCSLESHCRKIHGQTLPFTFNERRTKLYVCEECGHSTPSLDVHFNHLRTQHPGHPALERPHHDRRQFKFCSGGAVHVAGGGDGDGDGGGGGGGDSGCSVADGCCSSSSSSCCSESGDGVEEGSSGGGEGNGKVEVERVLMMKGEKEEVDVLGGGEGHLQIY